jgi:hypothetical protein
MKLFNLFKSKTPDCDLDSIMNLDCSMIDPKYANEIKRSLGRITTAYYNSLNPRSFLRTEASIAKKKLWPGWIAKNELPEAISEFLKAHGIETTVSIVLKSEFNNI